MNFVEAAIALLRERQTPLHVEELCQLALERGLIEKPGKTPLRSMRTRLSTELKLGEGSRLRRVGDDVWALTDGGVDLEPAGQDSTADLEAEAAAFDDDDAAAAARGGEDDDEDDEEIAADELGDDDDGEDEDATAELGDDDEDDEFDDEEDTGVIRVDRDLGVPPAVAEGDPGASAASEDDDLEDDELDEGPDDRPPMSAEEIELDQVYGDEPAATTPAAAINEYRDAQTADEDRVMLPEIVPERRGRRDREERGGRRRRGGRGDRPERGARPERDERNDRAGAPIAVRPAGEAPGRLDGAETEAPAEGGASEAAASGPLGLTEAAVQVLASIKGAQPVPVRQLAQMMKKRRLFEGDPDVVWRSLKAGLLADQQRRIALGLSPRVVYRGRDLFAYRGAQGAVDAAEAQLERALRELGAAVERTLAVKLGELNLAALEQVAQLYLAGIGWSAIEWIKRVDRSSYATAFEPGGREPILVGVRAGRDAVDRRGVGELRAGITAKNLTRGLLLAPSPLSADAENELDRPGRPLALLVGPTLVAALVRAGVGVQQRAIAIAVPDLELLDRLGDA